MAFKYIRKKLLICPYIVFSIKTGATYCFHFFIDIRLFVIQMDKFYLIVIIYKNLFIKD